MLSEVGHLIDILYLENIIKKVTVYDSKDANVLNYDSDQIMIKGNQIGVLEQFASNIGKFSSKAQKGSANWFLNLMRD